MTEGQIEYITDRKMESLALEYLETSMTKKEYEARLAKIKNWAKNQ